MSDDLRERLIRADPARSGKPPLSEERLNDLKERIVSTPVTDPAPVRTNRTWAVAMAAVAVAFLAVAGGIAFLNGSETPPIATGPALELDAGEDDPMAMCIVFSTDELDRVAEIAFEGTVTSADGERVILTVDTWFRGGDADSVALNAPQGMEALIGGIPFEIGGQYLITAQDGAVNYCGFTGPTTPELKAAFETAFGQD